MLCVEGVYRAGATGLNLVFSSFRLFAMQVERFHTYCREVRQPESKSFWWSVFETLRGSREGRTHVTAAGVLVHAANCRRRPPSNPGVALYFHAAL